MIVQLPRVSSFFAKKIIQHSLTDSFNGGTLSSSIKNSKIVGKWVNGKWQPFLEAHDKAEKNVSPSEAEKDDNTAKAKQQALMATEFIEEMRKDGFMD